MWLIQWFYRAGCGDIQAPLPSASPHVRDVTDGDRNHGCPLVGFTVGKGNRFSENHVNKQEISEGVSDTA